MCCLLLHCCFLPYGAQCAYGVKKSWNVFTGHVSVIYRQWSGKKCVETQDCSKHITFTIVHGSSENNGNASAKAASCELALNVSGIISLAICLWLWTSLLILSSQSRCFICQKYIVMFSFLCLSKSQVFFSCPVHEFQIVFFFLIWRCVYIHQ